MTLNPYLKCKSQRYTDVRYHLFVDALQELFKLALCFSTSVNTFPNFPECLLRISCIKGEGKGQNEKKKNLTQKCRSASPGLKFLLKQESLKTKNKTLKATILSGYFRYSKAQGHPVGLFSHWAKSIGLFHSIVTVFADRRQVIYLRASRFPPRLFKPKYFCNKFAFYNLKHRRNHNFAQLKLFQILSRIIVKTHHNNKDLTTSTTLTAKMT